MKEFKDHLAVVTGAARAAAALKKSRLSPRVVGERMSKPKSGRHARRRHAEAVRRTPRHDHAGGLSESPARRDSPGQRRLLDRILDTPHLAHVVPRLQPEMLHRIIQSCGLEDCGELVVLATPDQLMRVFDLDLWRSDRPGRDEALDGDRFGVWLDVLMESGAAVAAQKLVGVDTDLVIAALAQHVLVFDRAAVSSFTTMDGEEVAPSRRPGGALGCEIGGSQVEARRTESGDAIVAVLLCLDAEHHDYFNHLMGGCRRLSNSAPEADGFHDLPTDTEQDMFDLAFDREGRREKLGYVTPAQACAFLQMARQLQLGRETPPLRNPVADAYFRAIEWTAPVDTGASPESSRLPEASGSSPGPTDCANAIAAIVDALTEAGVLPQQPRALLAGPHGDAPRLARIQAQMQFARDCDHAAYSMRTEEFAYLANAMVAGCSIQARPFTVREASDAAAAVCNLGLENWPTQWLAEQARAISSAVDAGTTLPEGFLVNHDLIGVFQVGWTVLHSDVAMYAAEQLIQVLTGLRNDDRQIQADLDALRIEMGRHWRDGAPWRARGALDVIMLLDMPAWATLLGLIDECPVIPAAIGASRGSRTRAFSASTFEFISESAQIASVHEFMESLAKTLG